MGMKRCENDMHFYDPGKHDSCPYCRSINNNVEKTAGMQQEQKPQGSQWQGTPHDIGNQSTLGMNKTPPRQEFFASSGEPDEVTVGVFDKYNPTVGWLVCIDGYSRGKDYRIKLGINKIGRDAGNDIYIEGDKKISRVNHAEILYLPDENEFLLRRLDNIMVKLNDETVVDKSNLKEYDTIQFGQTKFIFIPLCGEKFKWDI